MFARAALLATAGIALGLVVARIAASEISTILYEVNPHDSTALFSAAGFTFAVTAIAAFIPSIRAGRIDPASVLRDQ
jgi:putative ABC transport system permease protein